MLIVARKRKPISKLLNVGSWLTTKLRVDWAFRIDLFVTSALYIYDFLNSTTPCVCWLPFRLQLSVVLDAILYTSSSRKKKLLVLSLTSENFPEASAYLSVRPFNKRSDMDNRNRITMIGSGKSELALKLEYIPQTGWLRHSAYKSVD